MFIEKRKAFDSKKMRIADNPELVQILKKKEKEESKPKKRAPIPIEAPINVQEPPKWKQQSLQFRNAMRAARMYNQAAAKGEELPPPVISAPDPSLVQCPHCGRRFNEKAAERHVPQCQNIRAKPSLLKKGAGSGGGMQGTKPNGSGLGSTNSYLSKPKSKR